MINAITRACDFWKHEWLPGAKRESQRWSDGIMSNFSVFYGFDSIKSREDILRGGLVKVQDLSRRFPNTHKGARVLYLVSSALPAFGPGFLGIFLPKRCVLMVKEARRAGAKIVLNQNGVAYPGWHGSGWRRTNRVNKKILKLADYVIYQSEFCRSSANRFLGKPEVPFCVLYNPVDTKVFCPADKDLKERQPIRLLLAGSHWAQYRVQAAIQALAHVRANCQDAELTIAGRFCWGEDETSAVARVRNWARRANVEDRICLLGSYSQAEAVDMYREADILMHTKYNDPCPRVVVEGMASGLPIVYSATGGVPELVGSAGVGVPGPCDWKQDHPPSGENLAEAVLDVVDDYESYSQKARQRAVKSFDVESWLDSHENIFRKIVE